MTDTSAVYVGSVMHRRIKPRPHALRYRVFWLLIDLDALPALHRKLRLFSVERFNLFSLRAADHGDGSSEPLRAQADRHLAEAGIDLAGGRIRLLCMPRTLGYSFNPLSLYFCEDRDGALRAVIYQVHNTFGQRHSYVIPVADGAGSTVQQACRKVFYVSPFLGMEDMSYRFRLEVPGERIALAIRTAERGEPILNACLAGERRPLTDRTLLRLFVTVPLLTLKVIAAIHWEALRLWLKGVRLHPRPAAPAAPVTLVPSAKTSGN